MEFLTLPQVQAHCRADPDTDDLLIAYANAAEAACVTATDRRIFASQQALDDAQAAAKPDFASDTLKYQTALSAAQAMTDVEQRQDALDVATYQYIAAKTKYHRSMFGIVVNDDIISAALLLVGHFYRNREENVTGQGEVAQPLVMGFNALIRSYERITPQ